MTKDGRLALAQTMSDVDMGAYGFVVRAEPRAAELAARLTPAPADWPVLSLHLAAEPPPTGLGRSGPVVRMDDRYAAVAAEEGEIVMRREGMAAWISPRGAPDAEQIAHPLLGHAALAFGHWLGRTAFHAGVADVHGGAWALLGDRGSGKSTTLAWLAANGAGTVADDILVLRGRTAFAGPRGIDLRPGSAGWFAVDDAMRVRGGARHRLPVAATRPEHRLTGWIVLAWAEQTSVTTMPAAARLALLVAHGHHPRGDADWKQLLDLAALPMLVLRRPRDLDRLADAGARLLGAVAETSEAARQP